MVWFELQLFWKNPSFLRNLSIRPLLLGMATFLDGVVLCGNGNPYIYEEVLGSQGK